ncbi:hypothetical protein DICPUDRAFT_159581 [Dictyostelium purpureum]|uniref:Uncharacterized protein n=1 Tax=Dictyostelium purpureum TaxID=5786 RepID=F1A4G6_DICPU|nr:uncharacterized protein DICPUDRAFT_159581 [Dictyostelium purpureum]EGC28913.1 hypothetical protein DICPUDRAFT_159581 [Dictyostelium purpureum]|eukprot:XP_003294558.1 hypothetical protein DICPUDRAFT_159581 [Dictyostelium purpureum]
MLVYGTINFSTPVHLQTNGHSVLSTTKSLHFSQNHTRTNFYINCQLTAINKSLKNWVNDISCFQRQLRKQNEHTKKYKVGVQIISQHQQQQPETIPQKQQQQPEQDNTHIKRSQLRLS